jgi:hypothetical protein
MNRFLLFVLFALLVLTGSCTGRKNTAEHKNIIPEKDLTSILREVHLADGLLSIPEIRYIFTKSDTLKSYIDIIEKYGYTKPQMDRTMRYYFVRRPKKLIKLYDKVLGQLSEMDSRVDKELKNYGARQMNIWPGKEFYLFPDPSGKDSARVNYLSGLNGTLYLKFTLTIYPDDQSADPVMGLYFSKADSTGKEKRSRFSTIPYIKDGHPHDYKISIVQNLTGPLRLKGWFIDQENSSPHREFHHRVENIILTQNLIE